MTESTRRPSAPTRYDWTRERVLVKERPGVHAWHVVYFAKIDAFTILNVYRRSSYWKFFVVSTFPRLILARGDAPTMHVAKLRAEAALGDEQPQQDFGFERTGNAVSKLPF